jgi:hypothetical protein
MNPSQPDYEEIIELLNLSSKEAKVTKYLESEIFTFRNSMRSTLSV